MKSAPKARFFVFEFIAIIIYMKRVLFIFIVYMIFVSVGSAEVIVHSTTTSIIPGPPRRVEPLKNLFSDVFKFFSSKQKPVQTLEEKRLEQIFGKPKTNNKDIVSEIFPDIQSTSTLASTSLDKVVEFVINLKNASSTILKSSFLQSIKKKKKCFYYNFDKNIYPGENSKRVKALQVFLNQNKRTLIAENGLGSKGYETEYFGKLTKKAVMRFQTLFKKKILEPIGLTNPTGIVGPSTRKVMNEITALCEHKNNE